VNLWLKSTSEENKEKLQDTVDKYRLVDFTVWHRKRENVKAEAVEIGKVGKSEDEEVTKEGAVGTE